MSAVCEDTTTPFRVVGIVGTGAMGRGIAQMCLLSGASVFLHDSQPQALDAAQASIEAGLRKWLERDTISAEQEQAMRARLVRAPALSDLADCDLVVEAIVEQLAVKQALIAQLESILAPDSVIASNTSSLAIAAIAAKCAHPQRVAGWHFFNPVPLMKLVEVIGGPRTDPAVCERLLAYTRLFGHTPVLAKDSPGFIVNHAGRGFGTEALAVVREGVADFATVDRIMRGAGFKLGPYELMDLTALDVSHPVMESVYRQFFDEPRFRPSPITAQRLAAGMLGRKTNQGFYSYLNGKPVSTAAAQNAVPNAGQVLWFEPQARQRASALLTVLSNSGVQIDAGDTPGPQSISVFAPLGSDLSSVVTGDASRAVAIDTLLPIAPGGLVTLMTCPATHADAAAGAQAALQHAGFQVATIRDSAGFVAQRVLAMIIAIACEIAQQRIASPADIDTAVKLGLGYPRGPLEWGDQIGAATLCEVLRNIHAVTLDPRYRPSLWLARRAQLDLSLLDAD
jgi:3-hydroxybutyryl-CoA dehydrogenase